MKVRLSKIISLLSIALLSSSSSFGWNLKDAFHGMSTNITKAGSYHDQAAGYYCGGGLSMRTARSGFHPISATPPSLNTSCSGIDAYLGSFSVISGPQLVTLAKNIGKEAQAYAFHLGLKTYAPQIENVLKDVRNLAMELNNFAVEDCQLTKSLFAQGLPKDSAMREVVCKDLQTHSGKDWFKARSKCESDMEQKKAMNFAQSKDPDMLLDDYNIFIKAAEKIGLPKDMREAVMSMTGTIVVNDKKVTFYDSLAKDHKTWVSYLKGGESASLYRCDSDKCLNVNIAKNIVISPENSYQGLAKTKMDILKNKFSTNTAFDANDIAFLSSIGDSFPLYDYISLEAISGVNILDNAAELVASYSLLQHVKEVTSEIKKAVTILRSKQIDDQHLRLYLKALDQVQQFASNKWTELLTSADRIDKRARLIEQHLVARERG